MVTVVHHRTKTLKVRTNGRSADFVTPNFLYGCMWWCRDAYCYVMRYNYDKVYVSTNVDQILQTTLLHSRTLTRPKPPNQTDPTYRTYDIGCSSDLCLHRGLIPWTKILDFFAEHDHIKATFATKYVNKQLLKYQASPDSVRIRFSLMPQRISTILEPKTSRIQDRIDAIGLFQDAGYEVHLNFSPIVLYKWRRDDYAQLFKMVDLADIDKSTVKCEAIFMTHNERQHNRNLTNGHDAVEELLRQPDYQEPKTSAYGSSAVRYERTLKSRYITEWTRLHDAIIPRNSIRYIF